MTPSKLLVVALFSFSVLSSMGHAFNDLTDQDFLKQAQQLHNQYRAYHAKTESLFLSDQLVASSKLRCAEYLSSNSFYSAPPAHLGENIWINLVPKDQEWNVMASSAIDTWYNENKNYDYNYPGWRDSSTHFTMLVWRNTRQIGCARCATEQSDQRNKNVIVCHYSPAGNQIGQFVANVMPKVNSNSNKNDIPGSKPSGPTKNPISKPLAQLKPPKPITDHGSVSTLNSSFQQQSNPSSNKPKKPPRMPTKKPLQQNKQNSPPKRKPSLPKEEQRFKPKGSRVIF